MNKKPVYAILVLLLIPILLSTLAPVSAWQYQDGTAADTKYEEFGPRSDRILIKLYADAEAEWDALEAGEIDITDWPLSEPYYDRFTTTPQSDDIGVESYGPELGMFLLDINNNPNEFLGNPEDSAYPNPVWPNNPTSCVNMRQAIWHLTDRDTWGATYIGTGFYFPLLSTHPESFGAFSKPMANPYPYSPALAIAKLESDVCPADGAPDFPVGDGTYRYHDLDGDGVYDAPEERVEILFAIRSDHYHRNAWGEALTFEMESINIRVDARYGPPAVAYDWWFFNKEVHLYTAGWSLGVDPDHVVLWHSDYYWHPGFCYNTGYVNDAILDDAADHVQYANDHDEALTYCYIFQDRFAEIAGAVPWWSYSGTKAVRKRYTGGTNEVAQGDGEDPYRGNYWDGIVNRPGYGTDDYWSFLNMHPRGYEYGNCSDMTIRWAFKVAELKSFNPVYSEWLWEWNILGLVYDSLLYRNPYDNNDIKTNMASNYEIGTYEHPVYGTCTKVKYTLRPDMAWADGMPVTTADVMFTFVEIDDILLGNGFPPPWWYSSVDSILSFSIIDAYNFEVLLDVKSVYALMWSGGNIVLPKHIWKPICEGPEPDDYAADPNMIGSGPWRFKEYVGFSHVLLLKNSPGSTVQTNHDGSVPITSPAGYFQYTPFSEDEHITAPVEWEYMTHIPYEENVTLSATLQNKMQEHSIDVTATLSINGTTLITEEDTLLPLEEFASIEIEAMVTCDMWGYSEHHYEEIEEGHKIVIMIGDNEAHECEPGSVFPYGPYGLDPGRDIKVYTPDDISYTATIAALNAKGITVHTINYSKSDFFVDAAAVTFGTNRNGTDPWHTALVAQIDALIGPDGSADIMFTFDLTGSMYWPGHLADARTKAKYIVDNLQPGNDKIRFGVGSHVDYPGLYTSCDYTAVYGTSPDFPWMVNCYLTPDRPVVKASIDYVRAFDVIGGDGAEDYVRVLYECRFLNWRPDSPIKSVITDHKVIFMHVNGYLRVSIDDVEFEFDWDCNMIRIDIWWRKYLPFKLPIESCTWWLSDIELFQATIKEDIAGSTWYDEAVRDRYTGDTYFMAPTCLTDIYPDIAAMIKNHLGKSQLPVPDNKVDIKDVALAAKAFGSYPGHDRWSTIADLNLDYQIDIRDIARIAKQFGWVG